MSKAYLEGIRNEVQTTFRLYHDGRPAGGGQQACRGDRGRQEISDFDGRDGVRQDLHDGESDPAGAEADAGDFP